MTHRIWLIAVLCIALCSMGNNGCEQRPSPPPPKPAIVVESTESIDNTGATVFFKHHSQDNQSGKIWVYLPNPEAIKEYRGQLEFALRRLEDVERRMNTHEEPQQNPTSVP